jgi:hypothetical protein
MLCQTKRIFDDTQPSNVIHFGRSSDNDREHGIIKGKLSLNKDEVGSTYDDVVNRIVNSCMRLLRGQKAQVSTLNAPSKLETHTVAVSVIGRWIRRITVPQKAAKGSLCESRNGCGHSR